MLKKWRAWLTMVALVIGLPMLNGQSVSSAETAEAIKKSAAVGQDDAVRHVLIGLQAAMAAKNVENAATLFTEDAIFVDQTGEEIAGQKALRERFAQLFNTASAPVVGIHPQRITFPAGNVAVIVGEVSRKHEQEDLPVSRLAMVMVKREKGWLVSEVTETAMQSAQAESRLHELNWLIGQWSAEKPGTAAKMSFQWAPSKKFIMSQCTLSKIGMAPEVDTQVIGWDPQNHSIVSWHFDSNGGFGNGTWIRQPQEGRWTVEVAGVGADGSNSIASNVFTMKAPDEFGWQSIHRSLDGVAVGDTELITVRRVKP